MCIAVAVCANVFNFFLVFHIALIICYTDKINQPRSFKLKFDTKTQTNQIEAIYI